MNISSPDYKQAFDAYFRRGVAIPQSGSLSEKQAHATTHYIWRARQDGRTRPSHAANHGKIFAWDNPPPTGHPGEDYGCRCIAAAHLPGFSEHFNITLTNVSDTGSPWKDIDFVRHYFSGGGRTVRVRNIGHLRAIVAEYNRIVIDDLTRLPTQIAEKARKIVKKSNVHFSDTFRDSYQMQRIVFSIGNTVIEGTYRGVSKEANGILQMSGTIDFHLRDEFRDPLDLEERLEPVLEEIAQAISFVLDLGGDLLGDAGAFVERVLSRITGKLGQVDGQLRDYIINRALDELTRRRKSTSIGERKVYPELPGGTPYDIVDDWGASFSAEVFLDKSKSRYA